MHARVRCYFSHLHVTVRVVDGRCLRKHVHLRHRHNKTPKPTALFSRYSFVGKLCVGSKHVLISPCVVVDGSAGCLAQETNELNVSKLVSLLVPTAALLHSTNNIHPMAWYCAQ